MHTLKVKIAILFLLVVLGYFVITSFLEQFTLLVSDPGFITDLENIWMIFGLSLVLAIWIYAVSKTAESIYDHFRYGSDIKHRYHELEKEKRSMEVFMEVAEREFMKRNISKQTFEDIQRIAGQKIVKAKAEEREMSESRSKGSKPSKAQKKQP